MEWVLLATACGLAVLLVAAFRLGRALPRPPAQRSLLSPVTQQHLHLFQGGRLSEAAVETAKARLRALLERGAVAEAEASLRPGLHFAVQVQALAELGSPQAGTILYRQLERRLSDDPVEQSWYWIDLAHGLRALNRSDGLPYLLRCPASAAEMPLGQFFAAETACCAGFANYLVRPATPLGQAALRVLHQALRGLRHGVQPQVVGEGRLGEAVARLWRSRPADPDPLVARVLVEALRLVQRAGHAEYALADNPYGGETLRRQTAELLTLEDAFADYISDAPAFLGDELAAAPDARRADLLLALDDLRADAAEVVLPRLRHWPAAHRTLGVRLLVHARGRGVGSALVAWARQWVQPERRARRLPLDYPPPRPSVPGALPYAELLRALRGHPAPDVEAFLVAAAGDWDPTFRAAAAGGLGWWEPLGRPAVLGGLHRLREDGNGEVRLAAQAALARLGERRALQFFRETLVGETDPAVPEAVRRVAAEGLFWLWPDLDRLADADDPEVAQNAREALEQLREDLTGGPWRR
jgi:hypothetical protein